MREPILKTENVSKYFGSFAALKDLSFEVFDKEAFGIAGPNGAGKTTLYNIISGIPYSLTSGRITFLGREIQRMRPHRIVQLGLSRTFQIPVFFGSLTYLENTVVGATFGTSSGSGLFRKIPKHEASEALDFVGLAAKKDVPADTASLFDMKLLMIASAVAFKPKLIMLDEPVGGLSEAEIPEFLRLVKKIKENEITIILVEHVMHVLMGVCDRVMVIDHGEKLAEGKPVEISHDNRVIKAYLGEEYENERSCECSK
jgi:branched-chain amino acid transport system ATP-binding protein